MLIDTPAAGHMFTTRFTAAPTIATLALRLLGLLRELNRPATAVG
jgi:hypothetical protein